MNIVDFCKKFNLDYQPVDIEITKDGKKLLPTTPAKTNDFRNSKITTEEINRRIAVYQTDHIAIHTNKKFCIIDVDWEEGKQYSQEAIDWVEKMKRILPYKKSNSKERGLHLFFLVDGNKFTKVIQKKTPYEDIEILTGQWAWSNVNSEILNVKDSIPKMKIPIKEEVKPIKEEAKPIDNDTETYKNTCFDPILEWIKNIPVSQVDKYPDWWDTLVSIKKYGEKYKEAADELSKKSSNYGKFEETWNAIKCGNNYKNSPLDDVVNPAQDFYDIFGNNIIVNSFDGKKEIYCFDDKSKLWRRDDSLSIIKYYIGTILNEKYKKDIAEENNDGIVKAKLLILTKSINNNSWRSDVAQVLLQIVMGNQYENIKFDNIDYLYHFKNTTFDLTNLTFRDRKKEDYCTMFACELKDRNEEKVKLWDEIINSIFINNNEVKETYLNVIINSFSGRVLQKFIMFNGKGSNGKSMLDNCFKVLHGDYYYKGKCTDLCQPSKSGSNPSLANCNKKRFCVYTEPNEKEQLQISTIKDLTGEDSINARKNFSNDTNCKMGGIKLLECNKRLKLAGDTGYATIRRILDFLFKASFKTKDGITELDTPYHPVDNPEGYQMANPEYETNEWREEHCSDLFHYLYDFMVKNNKNYSNMSDFDVCKEVKDRSNNYILDSNDFLGFIHQYCTPAKGKFVQVKDIKEEIECDYENFNLLSKKEKRNLTVPKLKKRLEEDPQLSTFFKKRRMIEGKEYYNILLHYDLIKNVQKEEVEEKKKELMIDEDY
jgi:hypothetical protein